MKRILLAGLIGVQMCVMAWQLSGQPDRTTMRHAAYIISGTDGDYQMWGPW